MIHPPHHAPPDPDASKTPHHRPTNHPRPHPPPAASTTTQARPLPDGPKVIHPPPRAPPRRGASTTPRHRPENHPQPHPTPPASTTTQTRPLPDGPQVTRPPPRAPPHHGATKTPRSQSTGALRRHPAPAASTTTQARPPPDGPQGIHPPPRAPPRRGATKTPRARPTDVLRRHPAPAASTMARALPLLDGLQLTRPPPQRHPHHGASTMARYRPTNRSRPHPTAAASTTASVRPVPDGLRVARLPQHAVLRRGALWGAGLWARTSGGWWRRGVPRAGGPRPATGATFWGAVFPRPGMESRSGWGRLPGRPMRVRQGRGWCQPHGVATTAARPARCVLQRRCRVMLAPAGGRGRSASKVVWTPTALIYPAAAPAALPAQAGSPGGPWSRRSARGQPTMVRAPMGLVRSGSVALTTPSPQAKLVDDLSSRRLGRAAPTAARRGLISPGATTVAVVAVGAAKPRPGLSDGAWGCRSAGVGSRAGEVLAASGVGAVARGPVLDGLWSVQSGRASTAALRPAAAVAESGRGVSRSASGGPGGARGGGTAGVGPPGARGRPAAASGGGSSRTCSCPPRGRRPGGEVRPPGADGPRARGWGGHAGRISRCRSCALFKIIGKVGCRRGPCTGLAGRRRR